MVDTKERILDAAERLFSDQGIHTVSLRAITGAAEANLAAVNYHFGNKEGLIHAVLARRIEPVNATRLQQLDELTAEGRQPSLEEILAALLRPAFEMSSNPDAGAFCTRLIGRLQSEAEPTFRDFCLAQFAEVKVRFVEAIQATCPHLSPGDLQWRFQFLIGALGYTMTDVMHLQSASGGLCDPRDVDDATRQLVRFAAAGFRAERSREPQRKEGPGQRSSEGRLT